MTCWACHDFGFRSVGTEKTDTIQCPDCHPAARLTPCKACGAKGGHHQTCPTLVPDGAHHG